MIVAEHHQHTAMRRRAGSIAMFDRIAGAIDTGSLAVPDRKHTVVVGAWHQLHLLRTPHRGGGEILIDARLETNVHGGQMRGGGLQLLVVAAERRAAVAGHVAGSVEARGKVAGTLHQRQPDKCLRATDEHSATRLRVLVVERDVGRETHEATSGSHGEAPRIHPDTP